MISRQLIICFWLLFTLASGAQVVTGHLQYADGEKVELTTGTADEFEEALEKLLTGVRDGTLSMFEDGEFEVSFAKKGTEVLMSAPDQGSETLSVDEALRRLAAARGVDQLADCRNNLRDIGAALEMWAADHEGRYPNTLDSLTPDYLRRIPSCPTAKSDTYSTTYKVVDAPLLYLFHCSGDHSAIGLKAGQPAYSGQQGLLDSQGVVEPQP